MIHKQLPSTSDKNIFVNRADSGCISTMDGVVYSVGKEVISMDWISLSLRVDLSPGEMQGLMAASFHKVTTSSQREAHAF